MLYRDGDKEREVAIAARDGVDSESYRSSWRRDYARVIHCPSFRRLQGKTQLFPGIESDFFRNRLTHSLEVAQIAKSIAIRLNDTTDIFTEPENKINTDIVETAGLCHDLGHPPFGHIGERALNDCMKTRDGGFEGNAQTLRILTKLEKRQKTIDNTYGINTKRVDCRLGLNLTYRSLAAVLKYDHEISRNGEGNSDIEKGYYYTEKEIVSKIKKKIIVDKSYSGQFKTIECQIMDIADDIAYSTYDMEDAFKAHLLTPFDILGADKIILEQVSKKTTKSLGRKISIEDVREILYGMFRKILAFPEKIRSLIIEEDYGSSILTRLIQAYNTSNLLVNNGYFRTSFTSELVGTFIRGVFCESNKKFPCLSKVKLYDHIAEQVEVLKHFTFFYLIMSPKLKIIEYRGYEMIKSIFDALANDKRVSFQLLPDDFQEIYKAINKNQRSRVICDFIAGMTDRYALEFYARLRSENPQTIFKPQ